MGDQHPRRLSVLTTNSTRLATEIELPLHEIGRERGARATRDHRHESDTFGEGSSRNAYNNGRSERKKDRTLRIDTQPHPENEGLLEASPSSASSADSTSSMPSRRTKSRSPNPPRRTNGTTSTSTATGSAATTPTSANMNGSFRERNKHHSALEVPDDTSAQAARLMERSSFTLDEAPPPISPFGEKDGPGSASESKGFFELPMQDRRNFLLLVLLYFLQGIPMGLAGGSVPFLLKSHLSYGQIGVYSLASYPYSLKLLWSPIVDAIWSQRVGRRKSWILPIQALSGLGMIYLGRHAQEMMEAAGANGGAGVWNFTGWWFALVFMCATQDIAVDGWALTLLTPSNLSYASTAQTVGLTAGHFLSYTVFLALSSPDFTNKYFRPATAPLPEGLMTLNTYLQFWGYAYLVVTLGLAFLKRESREKRDEGVWGVYKTMGGILKLRNIQIFILIHLIAKIGFQANDAVTNLKLLDKGFSQEDLALTVLIDFPFEIALGYYAGKWSEQYQPIRVWCWAFMGRLAAAVFAQLVVMAFPVGGTTGWYLGVVIVEHVFSTFMSTVMFVAISAFHAKIADPLIGGTYMTLLATVSNLGGTFPRFFVLRFVDAFSVATCIPPANAPADLKSALITEPFSCVLEAEKHRCLNGGGVCDVSRDGYYIVNILCVVFGIVTFWGFIKPRALALQALPMRAWRLSG
ncbi:hypothetical protein LTR62_002224 [Meristemomyces frigidus]|uniref:Uncharacterized protein n=1 Tax=Meristemomyces frigidus TaxID=1508187 RepID=A0AAN7YQ98_9PEZI|nr:hypothetical protein LTR62_002224 [Meristemomyces frigidus]